MSDHSVYDDVLIRPLDIERDAEGLAEMWMASELAWPDGANRGIPVTPELAAEWEAERRLLIAYVAEIDGKVVGYCSFQKGEDEKEGEPYLGLLNVHPGYHGHSIGRKLVQTTIERSVAEGWKYQTLHTWSANFKAVPAYKKTGHFWAPDSSVLMENFVPGALQLSLAEPFFDRHDWYRCYAREIKQGWDDESWQGLAVYTYRWEAEGETLTLRYDRESRGLVSVETDDLGLSAVVDTREPLTGSSCKMIWQAINKGQSSVSISLRATADKGLTLDYAMMFVLAAGESRTLETKVKVADDASAETDRGTAPSVLTDWLVDGNRVEMKTGCKPKKPVVLSIYPDTLSLVPGRALDANIELHSELHEAAQVTVRLFCQEGLTADWCERVVILPLEGHIALPIRLCACKEGVFNLDVRLEGAPQPINETFQVFSVAAGGLVFDQSAKEARIETDRIRIKVASKRGDISVLDKASGVRLSKLSLTVAPPFFPLEFKTVSLESALSGSRVRVSMRGEAAHYEGLVLNALVEVAATGLGTIHAHIENQGAIVYDTGLALIVEPGNRDRLRMAHPGNSMSVLESASHYPAGSTDELRDPADYREPWLSWDCSDTKGGRLAAGVAWDDSLERLTNEWRIVFKNKGGKLNPGEKSDTVAYAFCGTCGSWQVAADLLRGWTGSVAEKPFGPSIAVLPESKVILTLANRVKTALTVSSVRRLPLEGRLALTADKGLAVSPDAFSLTNVVRGNDVRCETEIELGAAKQSVYGLNARLELPTEEHDYPFSVVRAGSHHVVEVTRTECEGQSVWHIDNGADRFAIAPSFGPSLTSWIHADGEMLASPFPQPEGFAWLYPSFGGLHPLLLPDSTNCWEGYLHSEKISTQELETNWAGLDWRGVRLTSMPEHKDLKGVCVELDYTTVGESSILRVVYRLINQRNTTSKKMVVGHTAKFTLGDDCRALVGRTPDTTRHPTNGASFIMGQPWAMVAHPRTGTSAMLVSLNDDAVLADYGQNGRLLSTESEVRLAGGQTIEFTSFYILAPSSEDVLKYRILRDIGAVS